MFLQSIWFFLWGLLWAIFFITDGFDFGAGSLYPFLAKNEKEKRTILNALGPLWDGNEVWLITAGGVTFAAFPLVYAVMFSSLYTPLMLILFALIIRGVSFEFRSKVDDPNWRTFWDICIFVGSTVPAILFGVVFANIFQGLPFDGDGIFRGSLITLLNPYGLLGGLLFLMLFLVHGSLWLCIKTQGELQIRTIKTLNLLWPMLLTVAVVFLVATQSATSLYDNYFAHPWLFSVVLITILGLAGIKWFMVKAAWFKAWFASALTIAGAVFFGMIGLFPSMLPSSINNAAYGLTAYNASSSPLTLRIMLVVTVIFIPIVIAYQIWTYNLFKDKVNPDELTY